MRTGPSACATQGTRSYGVRRRGHDLRIRARWDGRANESSALIDDHVHRSDGLPCERELSATFKRRSADNFNPDPVLVPITDAINRLGAEPDVAAALSDGNLICGPWQTVCPASEGMGKADCSRERIAAHDVRLIRLSRCVNFCRGCVDTRPMSGLRIRPRFRPSLIPGQLIRRDVLGSTATYRIVEQLRDVFVVAVEDAPGLKRGSTFRFGLGAVAEMTVFPHAVGA
jgi:hypothetical protein